MNQTVATNSRKESKKSGDLFLLVENAELFFCEFVFIEWS
jgi:hypothetical protein